VHGREEEGRKDEGRRWREGRRREGEEEEGGRRGEGGGDGERRGGGDEINAITKNWHHAPSPSMMVTTVSLFPRLRQVPAGVISASWTMKLSSHSTIMSAAAVMNTHSCDPLVEPAGNVAGTDEIGEKSLSANAAAIMDRTWEYYVLLTECLQNACSGLCLVGRESRAWVCGPNTVADVDTNFLPSL
jgi:hypothetical protein